MIHRLTSIIVLLSALAVHSQDFVTISGQIIDVETQAPLPFATVNIQNTPIGVVANESGAFEFSFSIKHLADTIVFSTTGYQSEKMLVQKLQSRETIKIELIAQAIVLAEVVVTNKDLKAWEILELALKNIKKNYPTTPFEFDAFYRDYKIENEKCISIFEAAISAYDKGYSKEGNKYAFKEKVVLEQVRKSLSVKYQTHSFKRLNVMRELLKLNDVRYQTRALRKKALKKFEYSISGYAIVNDRLMYKISAKDDWEYFIYVDVVTYAIPKIEMNFEFVKGVDENTWVLGDTIRYNQTAAKMLLEFQMIDRLYYPKYCGFEANLEAFDAHSDEQLFTSFIRQEYMVTDIDFNPEEKPQKDERMDPYSTIESQESTYDPAFWKNYNIIKLHPRDKELIQGLEDQMAIADQFSSSN